MVIEEPKYKDLKFESKNEFLFWLKKTAKYKITFEDDQQDFLVWHLDERGEVLNSDLQSSVWNGGMVETGEMRVGRFLPMQNGDFITHKVKSIEKLNDVLEKEGESQ
jgi:hypothetical protein